MHNNSLILDKQSYLIIPPSFAT